MKGLLCFCFGATAAVYAVTGSHCLALLLGRTTQVQPLVLTVALGGVALGSRLFGGWADRARQPLAWWGYLEVGLGLYAFFFDAWFGMADKVFVSAGAMVQGHNALFSLLQGGLAFCLLIGPAVVIGARLPVLAAWWQRHAGDAGRRVARLYGVSGLGAVLGGWLAGFFFVKWMGVTATLQMAALLNVLLGFAAVGWVRKLGATPAAGHSDIGPSQVREAESDAAWPWAAGLAALTGGVAMGLGVLGSRALTLTFGASAESFLMIWLSFLLGIAVGGLVVSSSRWRAVKRERVTHLLLIAAACVVGLLLSHLGELVELYRTLRTGLARNEVGYRFHQLLVTGLSLLFLGAPAGLLGAVLPLWIRAEGGCGWKLGCQVGRLVAWGAVGAVVGLWTTSFVLMPLVGLRGAFGVLAIVLCLGTTPSAFMIGRPRPIFTAAAVTGLLVIASQTGGEGWRQAMSSAPFRARDLGMTPHLLPERPAHSRLLFYRDAPDATVSVEVGDGVRAPAELTLRINGEEKARSLGQLATQYLLAHLPMLARPESQDVFALGLGSGITAGALLGHPVKRVTVAENCSPLRTAAGFFAPLSRGVLTNATVKFWLEDGRTVLRLQPHRYDLIISHPAPAWAADASGLLSREFFELAASRLQDGGLLALGFQTEAMNDGLALMVLRTFTSVFPFVEVWDAGSGDLIWLGSKRPWAPGPTAYARVVEREGPRHDLERIGLKSPAMLWARQLASQQTAFAIAGGQGPVESDAFPVLAAAAPKALYLGSVARGLFRFDERTWQAALAPPEKRAALATLDRGALETVFAEFGSTNGDLDRYLRQRRFGAAEDGVAMSVGGYFMPCVFQPRGAWPKLPPFAGESEEPRLKLLRAEALLHTEPEQWRAAVETIESVLRGLPPPGGADRAGGTAAHFGAVAARECLSRGDLNRAANLLTSGLALWPDDLELAYLKRVWERLSAIPSAAKSAGQ